MIGRECCKLGEHEIRKGLDVNFILINESNGSYLHYSKIDYIKFYSALVKIFQNHHCTVVDKKEK